MTGTTPDPAEHDLNMGPDAAAPRADATAGAGTPDPRAARAWAPGVRARTAGIVAIMTVVASESLAVTTVMPLVRAELGGTDWYGWVFSAFFLASLFGIVLGGRVADRRRPVEPFIVGLAAFCAGLGVASAATSMPMLVAGRILQGLGAGILPAVCYLSVGRGYAPDAQPRLFALLSTAWVVPSVVGPGLAAFVATTFGWRWIFAGLLPFSLVLGVLAAVAIRTLGPSHDPSSGPIGLWRVSACAFGAAIALAGLDTGGSFGGFGIGIIAAVGGGVVCTLAFRALAPAGTLRLRPGLGAAVALRWVANFAFFATDVYVPLLLREVAHAPTWVGGAALTAASVLWSVGSWVQERRVRRDGPRIWVRRGMTLVTASTAAFAVLLWLTADAALPAVVYAIGGLGMGLTYGPLSVTAMARSGGREGEATSALQLAETLGVALGTGVGGAVVAAHTLGAASQALAIGTISAAVGIVGIVGATNLPGPGELTHDPTG